MEPFYITLADPSQPEKIRKLAYWQYGDPGNPDVVLCVHGLTRNGLDFEFLANALSARYRVICPDMAGRGKSDWLSVTSDYHYGTYVIDCCALMMQLGLSNVSWIGTSMGGIIGMMIAAQQPILIRRMVLNDVGSVVSAIGLSRILGYSGTPARFENEQQAYDYMQKTFASFGITTDAEWQQMFKVSFQPSGEGGYVTSYDPGIGQALHDASAKAGEIKDADLTAVWNAVKCPALILRGSESDILLKETAEAMCMRDAATTVVEFKQVGHAPALLSDEQIHVISHWLQ